MDSDKTIHKAFRIHITDTRKRSLQSIPNYQNSEKENVFIWNAETSIFVSFKLRMS